MWPITKWYRLGSHEPDGRGRREGSCSGKRTSSSGRERYGRDWKHPSRAQNPLYKGLSRDLGRDEGFFRESLKNYRYG